LALYTLFLNAISHCTLSNNNGFGGWNEYSLTKYIKKKKKKLFFGFNLSRQQFRKLAVLHGRSGRPIW